MRVTSKPLSLSRRAASSSLARSGFSLSVGLTLIVAETSIRLSLFRRGRGGATTVGQGVIFGGTALRGRWFRAQTCARAAVASTSPWPTATFGCPTAGNPCALLPFCTGTPVLCRIWRTSWLVSTRFLLRAFSTISATTPAICGVALLVPLAPTQPSFLAVSSFRESLAAEAVVQLAIRRARHHDVDRERLLPAQSAYVGHLAIGIEVAGVAAGEVARLQRVILVREHAADRDHLRHAARPGKLPVAGGKEHDLAFPHHVADRKLDERERLLVVPAPRATEDVDAGVRGLFDRVLRLRRVLEPEHRRLRRYCEYIERNRRAVAVRVIGRIGCGSGRRRHVGELVRGVIGVREKAGIDDADLDVLPGRARRHFQKLTNFLIRDAMPGVRRWGCARREEMRRRDENEIVDVLAHRRRYGQRLRRRDEKIARARLGEVRRERLRGAEWGALRPRLQRELNLEHVTDEPRRPRRRDGEAALAADLEAKLLQPLYGEPHRVGIGPEPVDVLVGEPAALVLHALLRKGLGCDRHRDVFAEFLARLRQRRRRRHEVLQARRHGHQAPTSCHDGVAREAQRGGARRGRTGRRGAFGNFLRGRLDCFLSALLGGFLGGFPESLLRRLACPLFRRLRLRAALGHRKTPRKTSE